MGTKPETRLVGKIRKEVLKVYPGAWMVKVHGDPYQETGVPDLLICIEGMLIGAEVKDIKLGESREHAIARTKPDQLQQIREINAAGGIAAVVTSVEETFKLIEHGLARQQRNVTNRVLRAQRERELGNGARDHG